MVINPFTGRFWCLVQMVKFVVSERNRLLKSVHKVMIHRDSCGFAKEPDYKTVSSLCHGYFDSFAEALIFSKSLNVEIVNECKFCDPRHGYKPRA